MNTVTAPSLRLYRTDHRIQVVDGRCATDGIRVWPLRGRYVNGTRYRHDPSDIQKLVGGEQPYPSLKERVDAAAVEVARDYVREDLPLEEFDYPLIEMVVEQRDGYVVTADPECPDCAYYKANGGPSHDPSPRCESGKRPHCTCSACFD